MWVRSIEPDVIELRGRSGVGTPLIVGCALLAWPFLAASVVGFPTGDRLTATIVLVAVATAFIGFGWPRAHNVRLRVRERRIETPGRRVVTLPDDAVFRLVAAPAKPVAGPLRYGVALEWRGADPIPVLSGADPARVLADLVRVREHLALPVLAGWGLSHDAVPWLDGIAPAVATGRVPEEDPVEPTRRRGVTVMGVSTAGATALLATEIHGRATDGVASSISIVLPVLSILLLLAITFVIASLKPRVHAGSELSFEWRLGALRLFPRSIDAGTVQTAEVVSPLGAGGRHLLMLTDSGGFVAFPCERREGESAAARLAELRSRPAAVR
ncbi:MAG TPA: hypothetical protein VHC69_28725 [Polyangiaceae bacterium]|nr:hypothetical protein [Polyangiaceae bacterium]